MLHAAAMTSEIPVPVPVSDELIQDLICSICLCLPSEVPVITPCQHIFCRGCLGEALSRQHVCPVDKCAVAPDQVTLLPEGNMARRIWSIIRVKCGKHTDGCAWVGAISDYRNHILGCEGTNRQNATSNHKLNEELANAAGINVELSERIEELQNLIQQKDDRINQLNEQMETRRRSLSSLKRKITVELVEELRNSIQQKVNQKMTVASQEFEQLKQVVETFAARAQILKKENIQMMGLKHRLECQLESAQRELKQSKQFQRDFVILVLECPFIFIICSSVRWLMYKEYSGPSFVEYSVLYCIIHGPLYFFAPEMIRSPFSIMLAKRERKT